ncbi:MAG TPA: hypothetical protein VF765_31440 [Polyangiaceae bacterium]
MRLSRFTLVFALPMLVTTAGCQMLMPHGAGAGGGTSGAADYHPGQDVKDTVRKQEAQGDAVTDPVEDQEVTKQEKDVQHALAFALGREAQMQGAPPPESSSQALAELRAAHFKLRIEPVTNSSGAAIGGGDFIQLKDSFTDRVQALQAKLASGMASPAERAEVAKGAMQVMKLNNLKMQVGAVSRATMMTNVHVQNGGIATMLKIAGMVAVRKQQEMDWTDEDYARVKKILTRQKHWEALAAGTMGMLAAYEAVVSTSGDPKALDAIADATLKAFPLDPQVSDDDAKNYVAHLTDNVQSQKAKYEAMMRSALGDSVYEAQYKANIDSMFAQAAGAANTKSVSQVASDANAKYQADLAKCAAGQQPDPGSLVGPGKCKEARQQALAGGGAGGDGDDGSGGGPGMPAGAQNAMNKAQKGIGLAQAVANGDATGAIQNAADMFPGDGPIQSSLQGVAALTKGDFKGALKSAMGLASLIPGGSVIKEGLGVAGKLLSLFG